MMYQDELIFYWRDRDVNIDWLLRDYEVEIVNGLAQRLELRNDAFSLALDKTRNERIAVFYKGTFAGSLSRMQALLCIVVGFKSRPIKIVEVDDGENN